MSINYYNVLISLQKIYEESNLYWGVDNKIRSKTDRKFLHQLYEFLSFKAKFEHIAVKVTLHRLYLELIKTIHRHYQTQPSILLYDEFLNQPDDLNTYFSGTINNQRQVSSHPIFDKTAT